MPVVGTAGHVDHGKSTLVRWITGRDPDRWAQEKERGLTIDLGFAWVTLPDGTEISFVDVPGHEQFMKNMLAGIEAVDIALLVVAVDEGWMPQSEEHLAVLDLLGVTRGVVALTKTDRADPDLTELAILEIEDRLAGTTLAGAPIVPVSAMENRGRERLLAALGSLVEELPKPPVDRPRLWVDRAFTISGAGTVVTGTLLGGELRAGDKVAVWPGPREARVRGLQSHESDLEKAGASRRLAVNLAGLDRTLVERGAMLGVASQWSPSSRVSVLVRPARYVEELADRGAYHIHIGSGAWPIRLRMLSDDVAVIDLPEPLPLATGDRFILRETGRRLVMGGGRVLDPAPPQRGRDILAGAAVLAAAVDLGADDRAAALLSIRGAAHPDVLAAHSGGGLAPDAVVTTGELHMSAAHAGEVIESVVSDLERFHSLNPLRPGAQTASLAGARGVPGAVLESLVAGDRRVVIEGSIARLATFSPDRSGQDDEAWEAAHAVLDEAGLTVPKLSELGLHAELIHSLVRDGKLVKVSDDLAFLPEQAERIVEIIRSMEEGFTVAQFRDRTGLTRKYAVPLLEWSDRTGLTVRMGDTRRPRAAQH